jgi:hypothetical protein
MINQKYNNPHTAGIGSALGLPNSLKRVANLSPSISYSPNPMAQE